MVQVYINAFLREGIQPYDRILIYLPGGIEMAEIILCCFKIGAIATPISPRLTKSERDAVIKTIKPRLIITNWSEKDALGSVSYPLLCIEELPGSSGGCSVFTNEYENNPEDICVILLTSGTTGVPKAAQLTYENFVTSPQNQIEKIPKDKDWPKGDKWDEYYFFGGEDYELVFSLPKKWAENLSKLDKDINQIGFFTDGEPSIEFKDNKKNKLFNNTPFKHF